MSRLPLHRSLLVLSSNGDPANWLYLHEKVELNTLVALIEARYLNG